ncbi:hypothetical protein [Myxococcus sp. RHSTA-1-4]|uniref:hypothetical protein n=1 Tax=Myxococcus sp. RHSTA-1-4 TaxID=2874601 RepID=UPI001CBE4731|nr:hypothetical protein [Myxococcus sp. RHSTA-1-4]MBZ4420413.1 hypothetical protein [Myxococcus sp. RHSTA-1-4]
MNQPVEWILERSRLLRETHRFRPRELFRLVRNTDSGELESEWGRNRQVQSEVEALDASRDWEGFSVAYDVLSIRADIYLYFWREDGGTCLAVETDSQVPYLESGGMAEGEWLERFMCSYVAACGASACAHGRGWSATYKPLEPRQLVSELRDGTLFTRPLPGFYMLSEQFLSVDTVSALLQSHEAKRSAQYFLMRYFKVAGGYHVFSSVCQRSWWED